MPVLRLAIQPLGERVPEFKSPCVLVITRERGLVQLLRLAFSPAGMTVCDVPGVEEALQAIADFEPNVVLIDSQSLAPGYVSGDLEQLRMLDNNRRVPLLLLVAEGMERAALWSFDVDDYVILPVDASVIAGRAQTLIRQSRPAAGAPPVVRMGNVRINFARRRCLVGKRRVRFTHPEWRLLEVLAMADGEAVSSEKILRGVWGPGFEDDREMLGVWVERIRRAIEEEPAAPQVVVGDVQGGFALGSRCSPAED